MERRAGRTRSSRPASRVRATGERGVAALRRVESSLACLRVARWRSGAGLPVVAVPRPHLSSVVVAVHVAVGPWWERPTNNGVSHFLEHMVFRGTPSHPSAHQLALAFERLGSSLFAATFADHGTFAVQAPRENLAAVLDVLGETLVSPLLQGIEQERGIVREEVLDLVDGRGRPIDADELLRARTFPDHGLGMPITGGLAEVERLDRRALLRHHQRHYVAGGMALTVVGAVDDRFVRRLVDDAFPVRPSPRPRTPPPPAPLAAPTHFHRDHDDSKVEFRVGFRAPPETHPAEPAAEMLLRILDDGMSTRLYRAVCEDRGLAYEVGAGYEAYRDAGLVDVVSNAAPSRVARVAETVVEVLSELAEHGPREEELDKARHRLGWHLEELLDDPAELASFVGLGELWGARRTPAARLGELLAITGPQIRDVAQAVFSSPERVGVTVGRLGASQVKAVERALSRLG